MIYESTTYRNFWAWLIKIIADIDVNLELAIEFARTLGDE